MTTNNVKGDLRSGLRKSLMRLVQIQFIQETLYEETCVATCTSLLGDLRSDLRKSHRRLAQRPAQVS